MIPIPYHTVEKKGDKIYVNKNVLSIQPQALQEAIYEELLENKGKTKTTGLYLPLTQVLYRVYASTQEHEQDIWQRLLPYDNMLFSKTITPNAVIPWAKKTYGLRLQEQDSLQSPIQKVNTQAIEQSINTMDKGERTGWLSIMEETHSVLLALYAKAHEKDATYIVEEALREEIAQRRQWGEDDEASHRYDRIHKHIEKLLQWIRLTKI